MQIELLNIDLEQFMVHPHVLRSGESVYLVQPKHIGAKFTQHNKIFRSSVWNSEGELISAAMPKFVNWGENPENFPVPTSLDGCQLVTKVDGSLLCVSRYNGVTIVRTRGTVDATKLESGDEINVLAQKYPLAFSFTADDGQEVGTADYSLIYEWVGRQKIVINYGDEPDIFLIGRINHKDYSLWQQKDLDWLAERIGVKRPSYFNYNSIEEMKASVDALKGAEGVCIYSSNGQSIHKLKGQEYLALHRFKSNATLENTIDLFFEFDCPVYQEFEHKLIEKFDHECFAMVRGFASKVCDAHKEVKEIITGMTRFVDDKVKKLPTRAEQAKLVLSSYGSSGRSGMCFTLLDNKPLNNEQIKKLIYQVLKNN